MNHNHAFLVTIEQEDLPGVRKFTAEQLRKKIRVSLGASDMEANVRMAPRSE